MKRRRIYAAIALAIPVVVIVARIYSLQPVLVATLKPAREGYPWTAPRILARLPNTESSSYDLSLTVQAPSSKSIDLYPLEIKMLLNGELLETFRFEKPAAGNRHILQTSISAPERNDEVAEIVLISGSYFTEIEDPRMKSYRLVEAAIR